MKHGKNYREALKKYDPQQSYAIDKACELVKSLHYVKFDETVELHVALRLGKSQSVRDTLVFPNQFTAEKKVLVFCSEDRAKEALDAGAAYAGSTEYIDKVKGDMMKDVGRLGMVLGRKGLMPNPKTGTVTNDIVSAINELKKGRTEYRADKTGIIHIAVGKVSMEPAKVAENVNTLLSELNRKKPADAKADFIRSVSVSSSMGPGVWVEVASEKEEA